MTPDAVSTAELAPAKINLALHVTGRRGDGYHLIDSLVVFTRFGDRVETRPGRDDSFAVTGPICRRRAARRRQSGAEGARRAAPAFRRRQSARRSPSRWKRTCRSPPASAADRATRQRCCAAWPGLWQLDLDDAELARIGAPLGADVPMCLAARPLVARGIGDELSILADFPALGLVLVNPGVAVVDGRGVRGACTRRQRCLPPLPRRIEFHSLRNWLEITRNDLEPPAQAIEPAIDAALSALNKAGAGFARMSGSGATCFGLFETGNVAKRAAADIRDRQPDWFVAATRSIASEATA